MAQEHTRDLTIEETEVRKAALVFRAINHRLRQQILRLLHEKGQMTVTELYSRLFLEQSEASQHLAILRKANYVLTRRSGKFIYYSVNYQRLAEIREAAEKLLGTSIQPAKNSHGQLV